MEWYCPTLDKSLANFEKKDMPSLFSTHSMQSLWTLDDEDSYKAAS